MADPLTVTGWKIALEERAALLERFSPKYERAIADHVTNEAAGVVFVRRRNARDILVQLSGIFPSIRAPEQAPGLRPQP